MCICLVSMYMCVFVYVCLYLSGVHVCVYLSVVYNVCICSSTFMDCPCMYLCVNAMLCPYVNMRIWLVCRPKSTRGEQWDRTVEERGNNNDFSSICECVCQLLEEKARSKDLSDSNRRLQDEIANIRRTAPTATGNNTITLILTLAHSDSHLLTPTHTHTATLSKHSHTLSLKTYSLSHTNACTHTRAPH